MSLRQRIVPFALLAAACGYSLFAATTTPFTTEGNVATGIPILVMVAAVLVRWPLRTQAFRRATRPLMRPYVPWLVLFVVMALWEVFNYLVHGSRADHPTFSSMATAVNRYYVLKAFFFLGWLAFAWMIVQRGSRASADRAATP